MLGSLLLLGQAVGALSQYGLVGNGACAGAGGERVVQHWWAMNVLPERCAGFCSSRDWCIGFTVAPRRERCYLHWGGDWDPQGDTPAGQTPMPHPEAPMNEPATAFKGAIEWYVMDQEDWRPLELGALKDMVFATSIQSLLLGYIDLDEGYFCWTSNDAYPFTPCAPDYAFDCANMEKISIDQAGSELRFDIATRINAAYLFVSLVPLDKYATWLDQSGGTGTGPTQPMCGLTVSGPFVRGFPGQDTHDDTPVLELLEYAPRRCRAFMTSPCGHDGNDYAEGVFPRTMTLED
jgi:hypothetical protein